jgi:hypothetical protein
MMRCDSQVFHRTTVEESRIASYGGGRGTARLTKVLRFRYEACAKPPSTSQGLATRKIEYLPAQDRTKRRRMWRQSERERREQSWQMYLWGKSERCAGSPNIAFGKLVSCALSRKGRGVSLLASGTAEGKRGGGAILLLTASSSEKCSPSSLAKRRDPRHCMSRPPLSTRPRLGTRNAGDGYESIV